MSRPADGAGRDRPARDGGDPTPPSRPTESPDLDRPAPTAPTSTVRGELREPSTPRGGLPRFGAALGLGGALVEVGLRVEPRLGLSAGEVLRWLLLLGLAEAALGAITQRALRRTGREEGLTFGLFAALHLIAALRFDLLTNARPRDPALWGGALALLALSLALGAALQPFLRQGRAPAVLLALGGAGALLALARQPAPSGPPRAAGPSVLLITLDTTRPDHLGPFGGANPTPNLDALAAAGARYTAAFATAPLTEPSHLALLSGQSPHRSGLVTNGTPLGPRPALVPHALRAAGLTTAAFVSGFPLHGRYGWDQAFDVYDDDFGPIGGLQRSSIGRIGEQLLLHGNTLRERPGRRTLARARAWLADHAGERFFLWVHLFDPHGPYEAPGQDLAAAPRDGAALSLPAYWPPAHRGITSTAYLTAAYEAELREVDALVGLLLADLSTLGRATDTAVLLTADHGESLTEHNYLFEHGDNLYDPSLHVPAILRAPGRVAPGAVIDCTLSTVSVARTLLSLANVADDPALGREGLDWTTLTPGGPCPAEPLVATTIAGRFVDNPPIDHALRGPAYKHITHGDLTRPAECFDLSTDPGERHPLPACDPAAAALLDAALSQSAAPTAPALDPATEAALRALGYLK